ncbi:TetR-like C-terminal domain-containing protein [Bifidobacterium boum]|uniref:TetR-like C-terminal domain-containing protein n=1 Tax=Bifidobacterium boum TaxID=78343 RepID=UPI003F8DD939
MGYSPATFYRYFSSKFDVMAWDYAANCCAIMDRSGRNRPWPEIIAFGLQYLDEQRAYLRNLLEHTSGHESFFGYMPSVNTQMLADGISRRSDGMALPEGLQVFIDIYAAGVTELICEWLLGRRMILPRPVPGHPRTGVAAAAHTVLA